jgi:hypothetical protein
MLFDYTGLTRLTIPRLVIRYWENKTLIFYMGYCEALASAVY